MTNPPKNPPPLLGPAFETQNAQTFHAHVQGLRRIPPRKSSTRKALALPKTKILVTPTKTRQGVLELRHFVARAELRFPKSKEIEMHEVGVIAALLKLAPATLASFLQTRKFTIAGAP